MFILGDTFFKVELPFKHFKLKVSIISLHVLFFYRILHFTSAKKSTKISAFYTF